jgi:hypothetical protein
MRDRENMDSEQTLKLLTEALKGSRPEFRIAASCMARFGEFRQSKAQRKTRGPVSGYRSSRARR